ncbi:MAG: DUF5615 family PIN-like protein [Phycisphaerales bacterium]|nr:DUF5615 family PIN-like protein [Phycisphaerales bacterium]
MMFLIDQPVSPSLAAWLRSAEGGGHVRERGMSSATDVDIFALAVAESRVIITADLDFARITALSGLEGPGLVLFRAGNVSDAQMLDLLRRVMMEVSTEQLARSVVVVDERSIRVSSLPIVPRG